MSALFSSPSIPKLVPPPNPATRARARLSGAGAGSVRQGLSVNPSLISSAGAAGPLAQLRAVGRKRTLIGGGGVA